MYCQLPQEGAAAPSNPSLTLITYGTFITMCIFFNSIKSALLYNFLTIDQTTLGLVRNLKKIYETWFISQTRLTEEFGVYTGSPKVYVFRVNNFSIHPDKMFSEENIVSVLQNQ